MRSAILLSLAAVSIASAGTVSYTSSAAFEAATSVDFTENYGSFSNGQIVTPGFSQDGVTYSGFVLTQGATNLDITNLYNSFSGLSLGADHTSLGSSDTYFFGGEGATLTFSAPVFAFGMFFNANLNSGAYGFSTSAGSASTGSGSYDTGTFVFAGIVSTTPFSSISFLSDGTNAVYNVPELLATTASPEPSTLASSLAGLLLLAGAYLRRLRRA